jgi:uncharacterized repeat protein (TIGR01451 family)
MLQQPFPRVLILVAVAVLATPLSAQLVVTPSNTQGWQFTTSSGVGDVPPPAVYLAPGYETPPLGAGSLHLTPGQNGGDNAQARHPGYAGTLLANLTTLSYSNFTEVDGSGDQSPYLILNVDLDGNTGTAGDQTTLHFEPVYQGPTFFPSNPQGPLADDVWQTWDARNGAWWSPSGAVASPPGVGIKSLTTIISENPNAIIINSGVNGGVRIVTGFGAGAWDNFLGAADNFTIGVSGVNTTYDFEPAAATVVTVTTATPDGWTFQVADDDTDTITTGSITIVPGPGTPPMGDGSLQFTLGTEGEDGVQARQIGYDGQFIRDMTDLTYSTYVQQPGSDTQAPYIILDVDLNNDGTRDDFWFFEPAYQTAGFCPSNPQAGVITGAWQTWDAANGCWYSLFGTAGTGPGINVRPLSVLLDAEPDARISTNIPGGSLRIVTGFGDLAWDNFIGNADALTVAFLGNTTTFDFEPIPTIDIADLSLNEGNAGVTNFVFNLTLSEPVSQTVTVAYTVADNSALAADADYTPVSATATFTPGTTTTTITVPVLGDVKFEPNESFFVNLSTPQFATINDGQAIGTILNDDSLPTVSFAADVALPEGNAGTTNFVFTVNLSNPSFQTISVNYTVNPGTATEGVDYADESGTVTFVPGDTSETIEILVLGEMVFEPNETFTVDLSMPANTVIADDQGIGTIQNDDTQPTVSFLANVAQFEGNAGTTNFVFTVNLSNASSLPITVNFTTNPGTATETVDYADNTGVLNFVPGDTSETITVLVTGDLLFEPDETFTVDLPSATNATITDNQALGTIQNDEGTADVSIMKTGPAVTPRDQNVTYTITVTNAGPSTASNVVVTDVLPAGAGFVSATPTQGSCSGTSTVTCNLGSIPDDGTATITLVVTPPQIGSTFTNTATVTNTPELDPTPDNNAGTAFAAIGSSDIPTLSEWALLAMLAALMGLAMVKLR